MPKLASETLQRALALVQSGMSINKAADKIGVGRTTLKRYVAVEARQATEARPFTFQAAPSPHTPVDEMIRRLCDDYERRRRHHEATSLVKVNVQLDGPIGLLVFGDPHLGSPLTNWPALNRDVELTKRTQGLFGVNIGDTGDNWSGKLAHLWAEGDVSHAGEKRLAKWFLTEVQWLLWLYGNHDLWSPPGDLLTWLAQHHGILDAEWSQRVELSFPKGRPIRIGAYHGLNGHSMWNPGHGGLKTAKIGARDHLICSGHIHKSFVQYPLVDPNTGEWCHALTVGSYKDLPNAFGKRLGGHETNAFPSAVVIVNPEARTEAGRLRIFVDTEDGADVLTFMRRRHGQRKTVESTTAP